MRRAAIRKVSKKRQRELRVYSVLKKEFLSQRRFCEVFESCCTRKAIDVHHINGRNGKRLVDIRDWLPVCRSCHRFLHDHPKYAKEAGFLK